MMPAMPGHSYEARLPALWRAGVLLFLGFIALLIAGCDDASSSVYEGAFDLPELGDPTIVSLTPSITQMLIDMGKADQIVGLSIDDRQLPDVPRCGSFSDPVIPQLLELKPDIVITESPAGLLADVPQRLRSLADDGAFELVVLPHSESIADIERVLTDLEAGLGRAVGDPEAAWDAWRLMAIRMQFIEDALKQAPQQRVLMLIDPIDLGSLGTGVTHDELLKRAGAVNAVAVFNTGYLTLTRSQLVQTAQPDVILIFEPGGQPLVEDDVRLRALKGLAIPAVQNNRVVLIDHPHAMLPSTSLPGVLAQMAAAIHPDRAEEIERAYSMGWKILEPSNTPTENQP